MGGEEDRRERQWSTGSEGRECPGAVMRVLFFSRPTHHNNALPCSLDTTIGFFGLLVATLDDGGNIDVLLAEMPWSGVVSIRFNQKSINNCQMNR